MEFFKLFRENPRLLYEMAILIGNIYIYFGHITHDNTAWEVAYKYSNYLDALHSLDKDNLYENPKSHNDLFYYNLCLAIDNSMDHICRTMQRDEYYKPTQKNGSIRSNTKANTKMKNQYKQRRYQ